MAFDLTQDDQRFLITTHVQNSETQPMSCVLNWGGELEGRNERRNGEKLIPMNESYCQALRIALAKQIVCHYGRAHGFHRVGPKTF